MLLIGQAAIGKAVALLGNGIIKPRTCRIAVVRSVTALVTEEGNGIGTTCIAI